MPNTLLPHARPVQWRTASYSGDHGACVEVADLTDEIGVRDSKDPAGPVLHFNRAAITALATRIREGDLDL